MRCRLCGKIFSEAELEAKAKQKSDRIKEARLLAKKHGEPCGATRKFDRHEIIDLRNKGLSIRKIASIIGSSTSPIVAALAEAESK